MGKFIREAVGIKMKLDNGIPVEAKAAGKTELKLRNCVVHPSNGVYGLGTSG